MCLFSILAGTAFCALAGQRQGKNKLGDRPDLRGEALYRPEQLAIDEIEIIDSGGLRISNIVGEKNQDCRNDRLGGLPEMIFAAVRARAREAAEIPSPRFAWNSVRILSAAFAASPPPPARPFRICCITWIGRIQQTSGDTGTYRGANRLLDHVVRQKPSVDFRHRGPTFPRHEHQV